MNITEIKGEGEKNILILTGIHGNEITPLYCGFLLKNYNWNFYKKNFNKITILNAINLNGIREYTRDIPDISTDDLNRKFTNEENSSNIVQTLVEIFEENDVVIDIHSSPNCCEFVLINQDEYSNSYIEFCENNSINYYTRYNNNKTIKKYCIEKGKICFTLELNKLNNIDYNSSYKGLILTTNIIFNIDKFNIKKEEPKYQIYEDFFHYKEGIFVAENKFLGDIIKNGDKLGFILNLKTYEKTEIFYNKNYNSRIICDAGFSYVSGNDSIYNIQPLI